MTVQNSKLSDNNRIVLYFNNRKNYSAQKLLQKLRRKQADKSKLLARNLAYIAGRVSDQQIKLNLFADALELDHDNIFILTSYSHALSSNNKLEDALKMLERALQIKPEDEVIWSTYGNILAHYEQVEEAKEKFDKALQINPNNARTLSEYGNALAKNGEHNQAYKMFQRSLALEPKNIITLTNYGRALAATGQFEEAFKQFEQALRVNSKNLVTLRTYAEALAEDERFVQSWEKFERALRLQPENVIILTSYGKVLAQSGQLNKSREIFERALQIGPNNVTLLTSYGQALTERGELEKGREILERALNIAPDDHITLFLYAAMLEKAGEYEEAISNMEKIALNKRSQNHANFLRLHLGRLYYLIKDKERGNHYFELVIQNSSRTDVARLQAAQNILAVRPYSQEAIEILQEITEESRHYKQAFRMLSLNLTPKAYFDMFKDNIDPELKDREMLNKAMYHQIKNELRLLKKMLKQIIVTDQSQKTRLTKIIEHIEYMFDEIARRQKAEKAKIITIPNSDYKLLLESISQTAHDIADFANNGLAVIESRVRRSLYRLSESDQLYTRLTEVLKQVEIAQSVLNDLKSLNEGLKIHYHTFKVQDLFENWQNTAQIENASISLDIQNGKAEFESDQPKITSFVNELVENSLKHNPNKTALEIDNSNKTGLEIHIASRDVDGLPQHIIGSTRRRRRRIPSEKKYLAITVSDNGVGIPLDKKEWIFLPLNTTLTTGSGLGLFIIKKTLEAMNGYILERGTQGAKFELYIPYSN